MTAKLDPYSASPGTFSTTSITAVDRVDGVTRQLTAWLQSWVIQNQGPVLQVEAGTIKAPEGIDLPFGWIMVWVEVTAAVPDEEQGEVVLEDAPEPEPEEEYPGLHGSHKPGCVLAPAHREVGTLSCYGTDENGVKGMWL